MPLARPSLADLTDRIREDFRSRLGINGTLLRRSMANVLATVWSSSVYLVYGYIEYLGRQIFAVQSDREFLIRQASLFGITPTPATFASGTIVLTGTGGTVIPDGTIVVRDDGIRYKTVGSSTIPMPPVIAGFATVECLVSGKIGNVGPHENLTIETPIPGANSTVATNQTEITGGFDEESTEDFRARYLLRRRNPPRGGSNTDYEYWALSVPGVTRAWVYPHELGLGTVVVRFVNDSATPIFPDSALISSVQAELDKRRPITAEVTASGSTGLTVDFDVRITPDTPENRVEVEGELADLVKRISEPGDGVSRGKLLLSAIQTTVGISRGVTDYTVLSPSSDVVPAIGELPLMGSVTFGP